MQRPIWRFGVFEFDAYSMELRRAGIPVKLREQSSRILVCLSKMQVEWSREKSCVSFFWPSDTFVDFDHSLNTAVMTLREALGDKADKPLYIETLPRRGYRFVAPVSLGPAAIEAEDEQVTSLPHAPAAERLRPPAKAAPISAPLPSQDPTASTGDPPREPKTRSPRLSVWLPTLRAAVIPALLVAAISLGALGWKNRFLDRAAQPQIKSLAVLPLDNLSGDPTQEYFADGMTDELTTMLAKNSSLLITSRTSVLQYKAARRPLKSQNRL